MNSKSNSLSDFSSKNEFSSKDIQPYLHESTFSKALLAFHGEHGLE